MTKTSKGLVEHMQKGLKDRCGYVWGAFGQLLTEAFLDAKAAQYPDEVGKKKDIIRKLWMGHTVSDCVGAIKWYLWLDENGKVKYDPATDRNVGGMYTAAKVKGAINTMPNVPGIAVCTKTHVGVYIGGKEVIEANSTARGWVKTPISGQGATPWTHWFEIPGIMYTAEKNEFEEALQVMVSEGIIDSPEMWRKYAVDGQMIRGIYARQLIIKTAKHFKK